MGADPAAVGGAAPLRDLFCVCGADAAAEDRLWWLCWSEALARRSSRSGMRKYVMVRAPNSLARLERVGEGDPSSPLPQRPLFPFRRRSRDLDEEEEDRNSEDLERAKAKVQRQQAHEPRSKRKHQSRHIVENFNEETPKNESKQCLTR